MKIDKKLSASGGFAHLTPHQGLCPWTLLGAPPQTPLLGSRSARLPCPPPGKSWICHCMQPHFATFNGTEQHWAKLGSDSSREGWSQAGGAKPPPRPEFPPHFNDCLKSSTLNEYAFGKQYLTQNGNSRSSVSLLESHWGNTYSHAIITVRRYALHGLSYRNSVACCVCRH